MEIVIHTINNRKIIKALVRFRMKHGHKPVPTAIWRQIHLDIGIPKLATSYTLLGNCDDGKVFVVEGGGTAEEVVKLPMDTIATFPKDVQDIIFEARETGEYNRISTSRAMAILENGDIKLWKLGEF